MFVSVVIPTYRRTDTLFDTINMVLKNNYENFEVIVVDQTEEHPERIISHLGRLKYDRRFKYIKISIPNLPLARNVGLRYAKGDVIIYIDDDVELGEDFIAAHVRRYEDPQVGAVAGRIVDINSPLANESDEHLKNRPRPGRIKSDGHLITRFNQVGYYGEVEWGQGCNMSFRRVALEEVGGFDERFTHTAICEEVDVFCRIRKKGWKAVFEPDAQVTHLVNNTGGCRSQREIRDRLLSHYRNRTLFLLKNLGLWVWCKHFLLQLRAIYSATRIFEFSLLDVIKSWFEGIKAYLLDDVDELSKVCFVECEINADKTLREISLLICFDQSIRRRRNKK
ncbi:glycosyltransferase family 2 protein [Rhodothermus marinus]|uniref:glycosyltransferase family 2 protein n=1 Tax=Rhodothermus marinus TaxID=29549 RepID=UPI0012BA5578|nr:glycosyltransferase family 2 protein [Rhodothermus marinus]BBM69332.1 hypothetical protein RmaAA213_11780 [Rhodothermus marinus]